VLGFEDCLQNDLDCVSGGVKLYSNNNAVYFCGIKNLNVLYFVVNQKCKFEGNKLWY